MLYRFLSIVNFMAILFWCSNLIAQQSCDGSCTCSNIDIAPAGIMNEHIHEKGKWMFSYRYMRMNMQGNTLGDHSISDDDIFVKYNYSMSSASMNMDMHMLMAMYGISDRFTIAAMTTYQNTSMKMNMFAGEAMQMPGMPVDAVMPSSQTISGFSDTKLYGLYSIVKTDNLQLVAAAGLSIPTGSINSKPFSGLFNNLRADYIMQNGTGTFDFLPGISLLVQNDYFDWGLQLNGIIRPFNNSNGYHYGNESTTELWIAKKWNNWLSNSVRLEAYANQGIIGSDASLNTLMEPSANSTNYGGFKAYLYPGINFYPGTFFSTDIKLRLEYGMPIYQYAQGIQMADKSSIIANLDFLF